MLPNIKNIQDKSILSRSATDIHGHMLMNIAVPHIQNAYFEFTWPAYADFLTFRHLFRYLQGTRGLKLVYGTLVSCSILILMPVTIGQEYL